MAAAFQPKFEHPQPEVDFVVGDEASAYGIYGNVVICFGRGEPTLHTAQHYARTVRTVAARGSGWSTLLVARGRSTPPAEVRERLVAAFREYQESLTCAAFVLEGGGFSAAIQRSVVSALLMAVSRSGHMRIFSNVDQATHWMSERIRAEADQRSQREYAMELSGAVRDFCRNYSQRPPRPTPSKPPRRSFMPRWK